MKLYWSYRKRGQQGADGSDGIDIVVQVEPVLSKTDKRVIGYEWYAYRIVSPTNHVLQNHGVKVPTRKQAIKAADTWYQNIVEAVAR